MTLTHDRRAELLGACRLFEGLQRTTWPRSRPGGRGRLRSSDVIARQGEIGTGFFVVAEGRVRVVRDGDPRSELGPGEFFGELSVIDGAPRNAQVVAVEPTHCLGIASWDFEASSSSSRVSRSRSCARSSPASAAPPTTSGTERGGQGAVSGAAPGARRR